MVTAELVPSSHEGLSMSDPPSRTSTIFLNEPMNPRSCSNPCSYQVPAISPPVARVKCLLPHLAFVDLTATAESFKEVEKQMFANVSALNYGSETFANHPVRKIGKASAAYYV